MRLFKEGWKMHEIDEMDIHFYLELIDTPDTKAAAFIDDVF